MAAVVARQAYPHRISITLCFLFGPLGYLTHLATKLFCDCMRGREGVRE